MRNFIIIVLFLVIIASTAVYGYPTFTNSGIFPRGTYKLTVVSVNPFAQYWVLGWSIPPYSDYDQGFYYPMSLGSGACRVLIIKVKPGASRTFKSGWTTDDKDASYLFDFGLFINNTALGNYDAGGLFRTYENYPDEQHVRITPLATKKWKVEWDVWLDGQFDDITTTLEKLD